MNDAIGAVDALLALISFITSSIWTLLGIFTMEVSAFLHFWIIYEELVMVIDKGKIVGSFLSFKRDIYIIIWFYWIKNFQKGTPEK